MVFLNGYLCRVKGYQCHLFDWLVFIDNPTCVSKEKVKEHEDNDAVEYATNKEGASKSVPEKMGIASSLSTTLLFEMDQTDHPTPSSFSISRLQFPSCR